MLVPILSAVIVLVALCLGDFVTAFTGPQRQVATVVSFRPERLSFTCLCAKRLPRSKVSSQPSSATGADGPRATRSSPPSRQRDVERSNVGTAKNTNSRRAPHQFDHTLEEARPFIADVRTEIRNQASNEETAELLELPNSNSNSGAIIIEHAHFETRSLDDLFPGLEFSHTFATSQTFRTDLRQAMREDIFDTTPAYHGMSAKARTVLLLPDSSLQGSWKCHNGGWTRQPQPTIAADDTPPEETTASSDDTNNTAPRMQRLTQILQQYLGNAAPTGDEFMDTIGALCGSQPRTHWIDIVGVLNRRVPHSWHQDTGRGSPQGNTYTVLLGFPAHDNCNGTGVFSHLIRLEREQWAPDEHPLHQPVLYGDLQARESQIVRPRFAPGREILRYRDVDVLHSSPDVAYRTSVMRFM